MDEMDDLHKYIAEQCATDPEFRKIHEETEAARELGLELVKARVATNVTQQALSTESGVSQKQISKIESALANPSLNTLRKLATAMGMKVKITFEPATQAN